MSETERRCGTCRQAVPLNAKGLPLSHYWIGTPDRCDVPFCSPECSLKAHQEPRHD